MADQTLTFLKNPYGFISEEAKRRKTKVFETRLLLQKTVCMTGPEAAALFYRQDLFHRKGATPSPIKKTLFGAGGLQGLDGIGHLRRKQMLLTLLSDDRITELGLLVREILRLQAVRWSLRSEISFYEELQKVLTEAVCHWANVPLSEEEIPQRTRELVALYDRVAGRGLSALSARLQRHRAQDWVKGVINDVRGGRLIPESDSPLATIAGFKDHRHTLLTPDIAAVELLNVLRPTVAVSVYMVFVAHALSAFPDQRPDPEDEASVLCFLQEVRRFYPFFPVIAARTRKPFTWKHHSFSRGERVLLDVYGTNHDRSAWDAPETFHPDRFRSEVDPYAFIPQGGGSLERGHRCPGEILTLELMRQSLLFLTEDIEYTVPMQEFSLDFSRMPALPEDHLRISVVKLPFLRSSEPGPASGYSDSFSPSAHQ